MLVYFGLSKLHLVLVAIHPLTLCWCGLVNQMEPITTTITVIAGRSADVDESVDGVARDARFADPVAIAYSHHSNQLLIADFQSHRIRSFQPPAAEWKSRLERAVTDQLFRQAAIPIQPLILIIVEFASHDSMNHCTSHHVTLHWSVIASSHRAADAVLCLDCCGWWSRSCDDDLWC